MSPDAIPISWIVLGLVAGFPLLAALAATFAVAMRPNSARRSKH